MLCVLFLLLLGFARPPSTTSFMGYDSDNDEVLGLDEPGERCLSLKLEVQKSCHPGYSVCSGMVCPRRSLCSTGGKCCGFGASVEANVIVCFVID